MDSKYLEIVVPEYKKKERLDIFLFSELPKISRNRIQKLIKEGYIKVNGNEVKANHIVRCDEKIKIIIPKTPTSDIIPENIPLNIVFEDDFLLVVNKRAGMVVHPAFGHSSGTLVNALMAYCGSLSKSEDPFRPGIVHRLDKDTSGLLVIAKNEYILQQLANQFCEKTAERCYVAVVWGKLKERSGTISTNLGRSQRDRRKMTVLRNGKRAVTHYKVIEEFSIASMVNLRLETGRTHQIRVQLAHIGYPVFGDPTYGGRGRMIGGLSQRDTSLAVDLLNRIQRQALHAKTLGFTHPVTEEKLIFDSELPEDMDELICLLRKACAQ